MYNLNLTRLCVRSNNMYGENQNSICDTSNKKKQHGFKAMEGADSENSFHE